MAKRKSKGASKETPKGVPEENVYNRLHWTHYIVLLAAAAALYLIINAGS